MTNAGNKSRQRTARWSSARLALALPVRDVTLICGGGGGVCVGVGGCHMDWGGKRGEGAEKLTLDISHLNAAAIVIHITVKAVGCGRRAECATRGVSVARLRARRAPFLNYYFPGGYDSSTGRTRRNVNP